MSTDKLMGKEAVAHIYNGILAIKTNTSESVLRWMKLEPVIQSEVRNTKINIVY